MRRTPTLYTPKHDRQSAVHGVARRTVLEEILRRRPRSTEELIEVRGIGPAFCESHGGSLLETLNEIGVLQAPGRDLPANGGLSRSDLS